MHLGLCPGKISRVNPAGPPLKLMRLSFGWQMGQDVLVGCMKHPWRSESTTSYLLRVLKNDLGSGEERCWKRGVCVTARTVWEVALCAVRHEGALDVVSDNLVVVNLDSDI